MPSGSCFTGSVMVFSPNTVRRTLSQLENTVTSASENWVISFAMNTIGSESTTWERNISKAYFFWRKASYMPP